MSAPESDRTPCPSCGAMNPPGLETCIACGQRLVGSAASTPAPAPAPAPPPVPSPPTVSGPGGVASGSPIEPSSYNPYTPPRSAIDQSAEAPSVARQVGTVLGWAVVILLALVSFVIAFYSTCYAITTGFDNFVVGLALGLGAGLLAVLGIVRLGYLVLKRPKGSGRNTPR